MDNDTEKQIEKELRRQQKFSLDGAIGRAGTGLMKGASPISLQEQAGQPPHPDDEYTFASVRETLTHLSTKLAIL